MANIRLIKEECEPLVESLGYDLVDVEYKKESGSNFLRFFVGKRGGVTIDDCQKVSELVGEKLDELDPISDSYYLEVSSPGLDRPLKTDKDLKRNLGYDVEIGLYKPMDGKKKHIGNLKEFDEETLTLDSNGTELVFNRSDISIVKIYLDF